jgi:hypothetical protein
MKALNFLVDSFAKLKVYFLKTFYFRFFQVGMELHISKVHSDDFGNYKCIAKNPRGQTDGDITLTGARHTYKQKALYKSSL